MEAAKRLQDLRKLRTIWRFWIVNPDTSIILGEARKYSSPEDRGTYIDYRPRETTNDSGFFALLGCPNGSGVVRMLVDHCKAIGNKTIECIRVLNLRDTTSPPIMYFVLLEAPTTTTVPARSSKRSAAGQRRDAKRRKGVVQADHSVLDFSIVLKRRDMGISCMRFLTSPLCLQ